MARALRAHHARSQSNPPVITNDTLEQTGAPPQATPAELDRAALLAQALAHVSAQEHEQALAIFRRLAAANPRDLEARLWVARLESWRKNFQRAEQLYREVLRDDPPNVEARLGLADALAWQNRFELALVLLHQLHAERPDDTEVLIRLGRVSRWQGRPDAASYYSEVLKRDPSNAEAHEGLEALRSETRYELETGYFLEEFDFAGSTNGNFVSLLFHDNKRLWLLGRLRYQNKFNQNNTQYTLGATYRFFGSTHLRAQFGWAPAGDTVIPNQDYTIELMQGVGRGVAAGLSYRFLNFQGAEVQVPSALLDLYFPSNLTLYVRYTPAHTLFEFPRNNVWNQGGWSQLVWDANRHFSPYVLFGVGSENFSGLSAEQLGRFAAQTYGAGAEIRLTPRHGFRLHYRFQNRSGGQREQGLGVSYFARF